MKSIYPSTLLLASVLMMSNASRAQDAIPTPDGPYFGQTPPGSTPEVFAPGIVSKKGWDYGGVFTPDMKEFYFARMNEATEKREFLLLEYKNGQWHESVISPRQGQPFISTDGETMYLGNRYKERTETDWSDIKSLGAAFDDIRIMRLTASSKGTYVFDEVIIDENGGYEGGPIRSSRLTNGKREEPIPLNEEINSGKFNSHPFIAPDESYILWDSEREDGYGEADIYISFREQDGSWGAAINLGDKINTDGWDAAASVTPDGKYILFHRSVDPEGEENVDIYWVDAKIIEELRPKNIPEMK